MNTGVTLLVNGSLWYGGIVMVDQGASAGRIIGSVGSVFVDNLTTLAPGTPTSIGTLTINNRLMMCNCSLYDVKVSGSGHATKCRSTAMHF